MPCICIIILPAAVFISLIMFFYMVSMNAAIFFLSAAAFHGILVVSLPSTPYLYSAIMDYIEHLQQDKKLAAFMNGPVHERIKPHSNIPLQLIRAIMSQQLNT